MNCIQETLNEHDDSYEEINPEIYSPQKKLAKPLILPQKV